MPPRPPRLLLRLLPRPLRRPPRRDSDGTPRRGRRAGLLAAAGVLVLAAAAMAAAPFVGGRADEPLVADLDNHLVAITTDFTGSEVLLFGSADERGEVVVVVHGPTEEMVIRRKDRVAGIWVNADSLTMSGVPAFYHVATTANAIPSLSKAALRRHQIGVENIRMRPPRDIAPERIEAFREALVRIKRRENNYTVEPSRVDRRGERLFRTTVLFPANVPVGTYTVETLLVRNGEVASAQTTPLFISKVGIGARIFRMAHERPLQYGIVAVLLAGLAGFLAAAAFRR